MTTYRLQAEYMIKKHGFAETQKLVRRFISFEDNGKRRKQPDHFWQCVLTIVNEIQEAAK